MLIIAELSVDAISKVCSKVIFTLPNITLARKMKAIVFRAAYKSVRHGIHTYILEAGGQNTNS